MKNIKRVLQGQEFDMIRISKDEICNLSRIPVSMNSNPCYKTSREILADGKIDALETELFFHYEREKSQSLHDLYGVVECLKSVSFDSIFLPWIHSFPVREFRDIAFLRQSWPEIVQQVDKMKNLIESIRTRGYVPAQFVDRKGGNITGYFLKSDKSSRFFVVSGNHRVAVLSAMFPNEKIPVVYEVREFAKARDLSSRSDKKEFCQVYHTQDSKNWPSVRSGFLTSKEAVEIAEVYINA